MRRGSAIAAIRGKLERLAFSGAPRAPFADSPADLRRLVMVLYALFGPAFVGSLAVLGGGRVDPLPLGASLALIGGGAIWLLVRRAPGAVDWTVLVAISPTVCCGIGAATCGQRGEAYLVILGAPLAWCAVLFEGRVVLAALAAATATVLVVLRQRVGAPAAALSTAALLPVAGLVAWLVHAVAARLREARRELQALRERDGAILEAIPDALVRLDREGRIREPLGSPGSPPPQPPEQLVGCTAQDVVPPSVAAKMREAIAGALARGTVQSVEWALPHGGALRFFEARFAPSGRDEVIAIRRDVTDWRRSAADQRLLAALIGEMSDAVVALDRDFRVQLWAGASQALYGWTAEEAMGRALPELLRPELREQSMEEVMARLRAGQAMRLRSSDLCKDGRRLPTLVDVTPLLDDSGEVTGFLAVGRDVSRELAAERAIRDSEERVARSQRQLALVLDGSNDGFWDLDLPSRRYSFSSRCFEMVGEEPQPEAPASFWWERLHPDDVAPVRSALSGHLKGETARIDVECRLRSAGRGWVWVRALGRAVERDARGRPARLAGTLRDNNARREANDRLRAALAENQKLVAELREALQSVKTLSGLLPICAWCKNVRNDSGYWEKIEAYVAKNSDAKFSHALCPECYAREYPDDPVGGPARGRAPGVAPGAGEGAELHPGPRVRSAR